MKSTWGGVAADIAAKDASFKEAWDSLVKFVKFRAEYKVWKELGYL